MPAERRKKKSAENADTELIVVAVGASAGGLEAITSLLRASEPCDRIAFVVAQHMAPMHRSLFVELLSKDCRYRVQSANSGDKIVKNTVYVCPPNQDILVQQGCVQLHTPSIDPGAKPSVDKLFKSLVECYGDKSVGVVLSGTGSDGSLGCRAIQDAGGITIVQTPSTAKYDGMPNSVLRAKAADIVLAPEEIAAYLPELRKSPPEIAAANAEQRGKKSSDDEEVSVPALVAKVRNATGIDFSQYKSATLERQIQRRILALRLRGLADYFKYIEDNNSELEILQHSFLISVTSFFRDGDAFKALQKAVKEIVDVKCNKRTVRIWIPACATGEEVYSVAITLAEVLGPGLAGWDVKIFATDIDDVALESARKAFYPEVLLEHLDPKLVGQYFDQAGRMFRIKKWVRDMCMFARHDIVRDPPFLKMDLISCRNLLIYLNNPLQQQIVNNFHYALVPGGFLFLGNSESIGVNGDTFFEGFSKTHKIFRARSGVASFGRFSGTLTALTSKTSTEQPSRTTSSSNRTADKVKSVLMQAYAPPTVQVDENMFPVEFFGDLSAFLELPTGKANFDIVGLANTQLKTEIRALINRVVRKPDDSVEHTVRYRYPGELSVSSVKISIRKVVDDITTNKIYLISFERTPEGLPHVVGKSEPLDSVSKTLIAELEDELARTRDHLQAVIEELETSNEELQSLNEELQASSEELQASNEELETTNEELQATNEELTTVNDEMQAKSILLTDANETLNNIQNSLDMGLIVVDKNTRVTRFTPQVVRLFGIMPEDLGQRLTSLPTHISIEDLAGVLSSVISAGVTVRREIQRGHDKYLMNVTPYRTDRGNISGAVLTFTEITELSLSQKLLAEKEILMDGIFSTLEEIVIVSNVGFSKIHYVSPTFERLWQRKSDILIKDPEIFFDVLHHDDKARIRDAYLVNRVMNSSNEFRLTRRDGTEIAVQAASRLINEGTNHEVKVVHVFKTV